jgi:hypothetical protein
MRSLLEYGMRPVIAQIAKEKVELFHENNAAFVNGMVSSAAVRYPMMQVYYDLVRNKKVVAVDKMPKEDLAELWEQTKYYADGKLGKAALIQLMIVLYTLEFLL